MKLTALAIRRPVLAIVLNLIVILVGLVAWSRLPVRQTPKVDNPVVSVSTFYPGASAAVIESQITKPIEDALAGIEGIDFLTSDSRAEASNVNIVFNLDRSPESAASDVRDRVNQARQRLPQDAREPIVQKQEADSQPIIWLAFSSDRHSRLEVADIAYRQVKDRLQSLPGVAEARLFSSRYAMRIWLDADRLAAYRLTPADVESALARQNVEIPAGRIEGETREFDVLAETDLETPEEFGAVILRDDGLSMVRLRDVARVELGAADERSTGRFNGRTAVPLGIVRRSTANPLDISRDLKAMLPAIERQLPEGMKVEVGYDSTIFIEASIHSVYEAIVEALLLVALVIFVFLRSARATIIPLVTIPVSLIGAFALLYAFDFSINTLTLLAMVLAIGLVVDDAIVMLENIARHIEMGKTPVQAAIDGGSEIGFAIVAMTLTLAAVYVPIAFSTGATGRLFAEFALTLAGAVVVSGFVALTLSPVMAARLLKPRSEASRFDRWGERQLDRLSVGYRRVLGGALRVRWLTALIPLALALAAIWMLTSLPAVRLASELAPKEDPGIVLTFATGPEGATLEYMDRYARQIEDVYRQIPEVERFFLFTGFPSSNSSISFPRLVDWSERERTAQDIQGELFGRFSQIAGLQIFPQIPGSLGGGIFGQDLEFVIQTSADYERLAQIVAKMETALRSDARFQNVRGDLQISKPELKLEIDRDRAASVGVDVTTIGRAVETLIGGRQLTRFKRGSEQYDVILRLDAGQRATPDALARINVQASDGSNVPLGTLVTIEETVALPSRGHFNKLRAATIGASLAPGVSLADAIGHAATVLRDIAGDEATWELGGSSREFMKIQSSQLWLFALALAFIYLVLAAQFESFIDPFVILLSVPLAFAGALLALKLTGGSLNIYSQIGLVTLVGLIAKHGILIVEFANQLRERGSSTDEAVIEAAALRLRPILMTTAAMSLGALPLAIAQGAGAQARQDIGAVIVGGLVVGTVLTLFVVPAIYTLIARTHAAPHRESTLADPAAPALS